MALAGHHQQASTSSETTAKVEGTGGVGDYFEQRRVRHITSILLRNVSVPKDRLATSTIHRPRPRRSISTTSTSSVKTIQRTPSTKSLRSKGQGYHYAAIDDEYFPTSDLKALRQAIDSRLCHTFITLTRCSDGVESYRTCTSGETGVNFEWGKTPGSVIEPQGLPLTLLDGGLGAEETVKVTAWYKVKQQDDKGKAKEVEPFLVEPGTEARLGWSILWQQDVDLKRLTKMPDSPSTSTITFGPNTILFGLSSSLAQVQPLEEGERVDLERAISNEPQERKKATSGVAKVDQTYHYYLATSESAESTLPQEAFTSQSEAERKADVRARLKNGELVRGYEIEDILRLSQLQRELYQTALDISAFEAHSDEIIESKDGRLTKVLYCNEQGERVKVLKDEQEKVQERIKMNRRLIQERNEGIKRRKARLEIARRIVVKQSSSYKDLEEKLVQLNKQCSINRARVYAKRVSLLQQLEYIYPIELVDGARLLFSIVGIPFANRVAEEAASGGGRGKVDGENDEEVSSALGMIGQVVGLMSVYLDTPIHYPIATAGSRSVIQDSISVMSGPRTFPLYYKGVESYRFEYAIFLLNKNIEQLMNLFGITILDIRNTLPNLKNLLVTLSASSQSTSRLSRKNLIGNEMISLKADKRVVEVTAGKDPSKEGQMSTTKAKANSAWGMSLLGWGTTAKENQGNTATSPVPVVRTLGST